jgi:hypothetical protein
MSELDMFGFIGMNRSVFATFFLCGVLMPLAVVITAYLFRNFPTVARGGVMVSTLIGVVMLTFFSMSSQNALFMMLTMLSERFRSRNGLPDLGRHADWGDYQSTWLDDGAVVGTGSDQPCPDRLCVPVSQMG